MINFIKNLFGAKPAETAEAKVEAAVVETKPAVELPIADPAEKPAKASKPKTAAKPKANKPKPAAKKKAK